MIFFFNDTATTEIYTLSLHDALPISRGADPRRGGGHRDRHEAGALRQALRVVGLQRAVSLAVRRSRHGDRKSTRLNSSHGYISYAVFCLEKKTTLLVP